jgi:hypothetical protein
MMARILRLALMALMAIASAVFIYGMIQEFNRLPPQRLIRATHNSIRRAANIAKLPETAANPSGPHLTSLTPIPGTLAPER